VYIDGEKAVTLKGDHIAEQFQALVDNYVATTYAPGATRKSQQRRKQIPIKQVA
jgi:(E)-4-hydroxy-3-methylbut-2-enyl-diphosphate synthase